MYDKKEKKNLVRTNSEKKKKGRKTTKKKSSNFFGALKKFLFRKTNKQTRKHNNLFSILTVITSYGFFR